MRPQNKSKFRVFQEFHPAAQTQITSFAVWTLLWLAVKILPSGFLLNLRDLAFLIFSLATLWIGWVLWQGKEWMITPVSWLYLEFLRKTSGSKSSTANLRNLKKKEEMKSMGSIHLVVGGICTVTTLIYLFII